MPHERTTVYLDRQEAQEALQRAKKSVPYIDINLSDLIRALLRKMANGEIKLVDQYPKLRSTPKEKSK